MSNVNAITSVHIQKLGHKLDEIRSRALNNIISKLDHGFVSNFDRVKKDLLAKLFAWFNFDVVPCPDRVLSLIHRLIAQNIVNLSSFGKQRFQNEMDTLRSKLDRVWHEKLDQIEEAALRQNPGSQTCGQEIDFSYQPQEPVDDSDLTIILDNTLPSEPGTPVSKRIDCAIRWLVMPWQPLVSSDLGVLTAVEDALTNSSDTDLIIHTCQLIINVMLQDFPAEVFIQRPTIITILQSFLHRDDKSLDPEIVSTVLRVLHKLTRSLRFRVYYYCDPSIANKLQRNLGHTLVSNCPSTTSSENGIESRPGGNYQFYQSSERSQYSEDFDDSVLQLQQMLMPGYCLETLAQILRLLGLPVEDFRNLKDIKIIIDLSLELVSLLNVSLMPSIWLCNDGLSLKVHEDLKILMKLLGDTLEFLRSYSTMDSFRITYIQLLSITMKLLSSLVPLELADFILPQCLKIQIAIGVLDAPIYLLYPSLNFNLQEYARQFHSNEEVECLKVFDEIRIVTSSMKSAILLLKIEEKEILNSDILKMMYNSKTSLIYHRNLNVVKKYFFFFRCSNEIEMEEGDRKLVTKLLLYLLANSDEEIRLTSYKECHWLVSVVLGMETNRERFNWRSISFLFDPAVLTELICHGVNDGEVISTLAEDILLFLIKGKIQMGAQGWEKFIDSLLLIFPLLQCLGDSKTVLGKCLSKMLDPDVSEDIQIPFLDVLKGNIRFLFSKDSSTRDEAVYRLIYLLGMEKNSAQKLPRLTSLHGLPLSSIFVNEHPSFFRKSEGNYQRSSLLSVLEILKTPNVEPSVRKSALVQINVMLTDVSLHKLFLSQNGLISILEIFEKSLIEKDSEIFPDSVIPILGIIKLVSSTTNIVRYELSKRTDVFFNILRTIFLFPNNEPVKTDAGHVLFILLFNELMMRSPEGTQGSPSMPQLVLDRMNPPFICKSHWKSSINRKSETSILLSSNEIAQTFVRQFWAWEWHSGEDVLWADLETINNPEISENVMISEPEFQVLRFSSIGFSAQRQLMNIQNSGSHLEVMDALDYLWMYTKLADILKSDKNLSIFAKLPWENTFERFLLSHPSSKEDCDLFVDVLSFLNVLIYVAGNSQVSKWLSKMMKNMTKSLSDLLRSSDKNYQNIHHSVLKLVRSCSSLEEKDIHEEDQETWDNFLELVISNLSSGDQQHFYNLVYLDWLLTSLTYLTSKCEWSSHKTLLMNLGNSLIELILSFHRNGAVSFMGLSITRNSIICLNHVLHHMSTSFRGSSTFWYENGRTLTWLPNLWRSRDPLVRASGLQFLAGLIKSPHTAEKLLHGLAVAPSELCQTLLRFVMNQEEACLVREQAFLALGSIIKNSTNENVKYSDSLKSNAILIYVEQSNVYHEISMILANIFPSGSLMEVVDDETETPSSSDASEKFSSAGKTSLYPRKSVLQYYSCNDGISGKDSKEEMSHRVMSTPALVTAVCNLLNNLIIVGEREVVDKLYENSLDKYLVGCLMDTSKILAIGANSWEIDDILEMFIGILTVLTNSVAYCGEFASVVNFSPDFFIRIFGFSAVEQFIGATGSVFLMKKLRTEVFNFVSVMSLTQSQHIEALRTAIDVYGPEMLVKSISVAISESENDLRMSGIACLAFLLSQEIQRNSEIKYGCLSLGKILDDTILQESEIEEDENMRQVLSDVNKLALRNSRGKENDSFAKKRSSVELNAGANICRTLMHLLIAHNYAKSKKNQKISRDKDLIISCLSNLLCVSSQAKKTAIQENFSGTCLLILKDLFSELNLQPYHIHRTNSEREKKAHPILNEVQRLLGLLMNFATGSCDVKVVLAQAGLADMMHKLWAWITLNDSALVAALKLMATLTTNCPEAAQSLTLTTTLQGAGPRKTPNTVSLIHVIIHLASREIDKSGQHFDNQKLHFVFHVLRNAVHVHECRVAIAKSTLLQFFTKIHPASTKRSKPWPQVEVYCLEFLIDFTFYEEGQTSVPKAVDGLEVLIELSRCSTPTTRILALSTLRNLVFNISNRPRILCSIDFASSLKDTFKNGSVPEIGIAGSILWSLVENNQKGKLMARTAGFSQRIQEVLGRLTLMEDQKDCQDLAKMLQYVISILRTSDSEETID